MSTPGPTAAAGELRFTLDNTYSKLRAKRVSYFVSSVPADQDEDVQEQARSPPSTRRYPFVWGKGVLSGYSMPVLVPLVPVGTLLYGEKGY